MSENKRGRPKNKNTDQKPVKAINLKLDKALWDAFASYIAKQDVPPNYTAVIKVALTEFLTSKGCAPTLASSKKHPQS